MPMSGDNTTFQGCVLARELHEEEHIVVCYMERNIKCCGSSCVQVTACNPGGHT